MADILETDSVEDVLRKQHEDRMDKLEIKLDELLAVFSAARGALTFIKLLAVIATTVVSLVYMITNTDLGHISNK